MPPTCAICNYTRNLPDDFTRWPDVIQGPIDIYPITEHGKPTRRIKGYICARCLHDATATRIYIKSIIQGIKVTQHAVDRFLERTSGEHISEETARVTILKLFSHSKPIRIKSEHMIHRLLKNNLKEVRYTYAHGYIFVTTKEEPPVIVTIENAGQRTLNNDFWYEEENG